jgi:hypothetical protein
MKKGTKSLLLIFFLVIVAGFILFQIIDKPLPQGISGPAAEALADKVLKAVNKDAWDTTYAVQWSFSGHNYLWDRRNNLVRVKWDDHEVLLNTKNLKGAAFKNDLSLKGEDQQETLTKAWEYFANDSFWLIAPYKIRDPGTERFLVKTQDADALMVHYTSGGITPGDTYLWLLDNDGTPKAWRLWVQIIPIGGIEFSWEEWQTFETGARIALFHDGPIDLKISNVAVADNVAKLNGGINPFDRLNL